LTFHPHDDGPHEAADAEKAAAAAAAGGEKKPSSSEGGFVTKVRGKKLQYVFFPCITSVPAGLDKVMDSVSCPIVAGAPEVMKAAFTKETDFFATRGIKYLDPAMTFTEPTLMKKQLFDCFGPELKITEDESDFAADQGWKAMERLDADLRHKGLSMLEQVEEENRVAVLLLSRPYHNDPGLNHGI